MGEQILDTVEGPMKIIYQMIQQTFYWVYTQNTWKHLSERYLHTDVHSGIIHSGQDTEATELSYSRWLDKEAMVHIYNGILLGHLRQHGWILTLLC